MENESSVVMLTDSEGSQLECEVLDRISYNGEIYCILLPFDAEDAEPEFVILREAPNGDLIGFDDGSVLDAVFALFLDKNGIE